MPHPHLPSSMTTNPLFSKPVICKSKTIPGQLYFFNAIEKKFIQDVEKITYYGLKEENGFEKSLRIVKKVQRTANKSNRAASSMLDVYGGVVETHPTGEFDAALQTSQGPITFRGQDLASTKSNEPDNTTPPPASANEALELLRSSSSDVSPELIKAIEFFRFGNNQQSEVADFLKSFIATHRNSNNHNIQVAVGSAIRKFMAIAPMSEMNNLDFLLSHTNRSPLPINLEIETLKMIGRNFETFPPHSLDENQRLAEAIFERGIAYSNQHIILRDNFSAAASLAFLGVISLRSSLAEEAIEYISTLPFAWFKEIVFDDLCRLQSAWYPKNPSAANWVSVLCTTLKTSISN